MKRLALFAIPLALALGEASSAQQVPHPPESSAAPAASMPAQVTPRQAAEMHADILMARKDYGAAAKTYEQILKEDPKNAVLLNKLGIAYHQLGELNRAERCYKKAVRADKNFSSAINNLGTLEYGRNHFGKAIKLYKRAVELGANLPSIYANLGYAYYANKEYPQAMDALNQAVALDPHIFERKGGTGPILQQRTASDPGMLFFFVAKSYAKAGDAERTAHFLKLARDDGYKDFVSAEKDPAFADVINDPRVQEVLQIPPALAGEPKKPIPD